MNDFEKLGKEILKHKYLYYEKGAPLIDDHAYDALERDYVNMAKEVGAEPEVHLIADWNELFLEGGYHACCVVGYPFDHPWASEVENGTSALKGVEHE